MLSSYPKMRYVDAFPVDISGQRYVYMRDPLALGDKMLGVALPAFFILAHFDGQHSIQDIQAAFTRQFGEILLEKDIQELIRQLDENYLLDNERFVEFRRNLEGEFKRAPVRLPWHAGKVYPSEPAVLRETLDQYFLDARGPGRPGASGTPGTLRGAVAPHIDFPRGGWCFAWAYKELAECCDADLFLIFGTAHGMMRNLFALTRKNYDTPLGPLETDQEFIRTLEAAYRGPFDLFEDEFEHRSEHSIEFQAVFLQYLFSGKRAIKAVPILCGSMHEFVHRGTAPDEDARFTAFADALKTAIRAAEQSGRKVFFLSGADLTHIGPRFGDTFVADGQVLSDIQAEDEELLRVAERGDARAFHQLIEKDKDKRRICGYPPIYTMLSVMGAQQGRVIKYGQRTDDGSVVTFVSMGFY